MIHDTVLNYGCTVFRDAIVTDEQYPIYSIPNSAQPNSVNNTGLLQCSIYSIWLLQYPKSGCTVTLAYSIRPTALSYSAMAHSANLAHWAHFGVVTHTVLVYSFEYACSRILFLHARVLFLSFSVFSLRPLWGLFCWCSRSICAALWPINTLLVCYFYWSSVMLYSLKPL
jgi:hypothetical protein